MKNKARIFYLATLPALAVLAAYPLFHLLLLLVQLACGNAYSYSIPSADEKALIPFAGVTFSLLLCFSLFPFLRRRLVGKGARLLTFFAAALVFAGVSLGVERLCALRWERTQASPIFSLPTPLLSSDGASYYQVVIGGEELFAVPVTEQAPQGAVLLTEDGRYLYTWPTFQSLDERMAALSSRMVRPMFCDANLTPAYVRRLPDEELYKAQGTTFTPAEGAAISFMTPSSAYGIKPVVKIHYYIFSLLLVLIVLQVLTGTYAMLAAPRGNGRMLLMQGLSATLYGAAFLLVRVMQYAHYPSRRLTPASVAGALSCILPAALAAGLFTGSLTKRRLPPCLTASATVVLLYIAEYLMLGGGFYRYGTGLMFQPLPLLQVSLANVLVILLPGLLTALILQLSCKAPSQ